MKYRVVRTIVYESDDAAALANQLKHSLPLGVFRGSPVRIEITCDSPLWHNGAGMGFFEDETQGTEPECEVPGCVLKQGHRGADLDKRGDILTRVVS